MGPWKKKSPAVGGMEMVVCGQSSSDRDAAAAAENATTENAATDDAVAEVAKPPITVVVEKVYEHLIVFDLTGQRPFVKNADPDELAEEIARLDVEPAFADNAFIASILAQRVDCENLYENVGVGALSARDDFGPRLPDEHVRFVDDEDGQLLADDNGGDAAAAVPVRTRADYVEDVDDNGVICFRCSVSNSKCVIL